MAANNKEGANDFVEIDISGTKAAAETNIDASSSSDDLKTLFKADRTKIKTLGPGKLVDYESEDVRLQLPVPA